MLPTKNTRQTPGKPSLTLIFVFEILLSSVIALLLCLVSLEAAYSAILGGSIAALASLAFAILAYRYVDAGSVHKMVRNFYQGELLKLTVAALLFAAVFTWFKTVHVGALFIVFALILVIHGFLPAKVLQWVGK